LSAHGIKALTRRASLRAGAGSPFAIRVIAIRCLVLEIRDISRTVGWFIPSSAAERQCGKQLSGYRTDAIHS
jgi:hypothetical protein